MRRYKSWWIVALVAVCFQTPGSQARGQEPLPPFSVLMFYDGSAIFAKGRAEALAGFAEDPDYLPVQETSDPAVFENAMLESRDQHNYHVFVAITSDGVTAASWFELANDSASDFNFAATYIDPADGTITMRIINRMSIPDGTPPPDGAPVGFYPFEEDVTAEFLDVALPITSGPTVMLVEAEPVTDLPGEGGGGDGWFNTLFRNWLREQIEKARESVAEFLNDLADAVEELPPETKVDVSIKVVVEPPKPPKLEVEITIKDIPFSEVAKGLRKLSDVVKPK